ELCHRAERRCIHVSGVPLVPRHHAELPALARLDSLLYETAAAVDLGVGLSYDELLFLQRGQELDLVGDPSADDLAVRCLDEAELVRARVGGQGRDQADVRTFRRLDRADPAVGRGMDVAQLAAGALAAETAGAE